MSTRYRFRLAAVLKLRVGEREQCRTALAAANRHLAQALEERDALVARHQASSPGVGRRSLADFLAEEHAAGLLAAQVRDARHRVGKRAEEAALAQVAWAEASRRVAALERLDERRRAEHAREVGREEAALVDDLVTARFAARRPSAATGRSRS